MVSVDGMGNTTNVLSLNQFKLQKAANQGVTQIHVKNNVALDVADYFVTPLYKKEMSALSWIVSRTPSWLKSLIPQQIKDGVASWFGLKNTAAKVDNAIASGNVAQQKKVLNDLGVANTNSMTDDQVKTKLEQIKGLLDSAVKAENLNAFITAKNQLSDYLKQLSKSGTASDSVKAKVDLTVQSETKGTKHFDAQIANRVKTAKTHKQMSQAIIDESALHGSDASILASARTLGASNTTVAAIQENIQTGQSVASLILSEAKNKSIRLTDAEIKQLGTMANSPANVLTDSAVEPISLSSNVFVYVGHLATDLMQQIVNGIWQNRTEQNEDDKRTQETVIVQNLAEDKREKKIDKKNHDEKVAHALKVAENKLSAEATDPNDPNQKQAMLDLDILQSPGNLASKKDISMYPNSSNSILV